MMRQVGTFLKVQDINLTTRAYSYANALWSSTCRSCPGRVLGTRSYSSGRPFGGRAKEKNVVFARMFAPHNQKSGELQIQHVYSRLSPPRDIR